jgi:hypothetical protein
MIALLLAAAIAAPATASGLPNYGDMQTARDLLNACSVIQGGQYSRANAELAGACTAALRGAFYLTKDEDSTQDTSCVPAAFDNPGLIAIYRKQFAQAKAGQELEYMAFANAALLIEYKCAAPSRLIERMMVLIQGGQAADGDGK